MRDKSLTPIVVTLIAVILITPVTTAIGVVTILGAYRDVSSFDKVMFLLIGGFIIVASTSVASIVVGHANKQVGDYLVEKLKRNREEQTNAG